jgi:hypothetical protein
VVNGRQGVFDIGMLRRKDSAGGAHMVLHGFPAEILVNAAVGENLESVLHGLMISVQSNQVSGIISQFPVFLPDCCSESVLLSVSKHYPLPGPISIPIPLAISILVDCTVAGCESGNSHD